MVRKRLFYLQLCKHVLFCIIYHIGELVLYIWCWGLIKHVAEMISHPSFSSCIITMSVEPSLSPGTNKLHFEEGEKSKLELPKLWLVAVCLHDDTVAPAKIPHTLHDSFPEASNVLHMWSVHFTVEADVIT